MNRHQMFNPKNYQEDPTKNVWLLSTRNEVLDFYEAEMIKPDYEGCDDTDMLVMLGKHIADMKPSQPTMPWDALVSEVAEGLLDLDEWSLDHYDIEETLMQNT